MGRGEQFPKTTIILLKEQIFCSPFANAPTFIYYYPIIQYSIIFNCSVVIEVESLTMSRRSSKYQNSSALRKSNSVTNHRVSYSAVSAYGGDTKRAPKIDGNKITYVPYNAGGGSGSENLTREALQKEQFEMFKRTITLGPSIIANVDQECRQLTVVEKFKTIVVNIAREDFPHINADIEVKFLPSTAQASWRNFMRDMMVTLDLQFIDGIIEKETRLPVFCILSLTDKGNYYVRQREESAVLEAIYSGTTPTQPTWPIIDEINAVTDDLNFHCSHKSVMRERVTALISKPVVRKQQMDATSIILKAMDPDTILAAVHDVMNINMHELEQQALRKKEARAAAKAKRKKGTLSDTEALDDASRPGSPDVTEIKTETAVDPNKPKYDTEVDVVTIHRHALESLSRLATLKEKESINNIADLPEQPPLSEDVVIATEKGEKENLIEIITPSAAGVDPNAPVPVDENKINIPIHLQKIIAKPVIDFIDDTISNYRDEADIVITALKLLNDLCPHLAADEFKDQILDIIVDTMQAYAPNPPPDRPRAPKRYLIKLDEKLRQEKEAEELRLAIEAEKIRKEAAK